MKTPMLSMFRETNFKETELGHVPEDWQVARLGEILHEVDIRYKDKRKAEQELPVLSLTKNDGLILQTDRFDKRIATDDVSNYKIVRRGQIVNNPYVIWEGAIHILSKYDTGLVSPVYPVWEVKSDKAFCWFIDPLLRMPAAIAAYNSFAAGAVNRRRAIRKSDFLKILTPLPPLPEQKAIAYVLRTVQQAKEATEKVIAALKNLKKSLMRHLFTYGPVPLDKIDSVPLRETELGPLPAHWQVVKLGDLIEKRILLIRNGFPQGEHNNTGKGVPHLRPFNITIDGTLDLSQVKYITPPIDTDPHWLRPNDIIFNNTNSEELVGKTALFECKGQFVLSNHMTFLRVLIPSQINSYWLSRQLHYLWYLRLYQSLCRRHVNQASISLERLKGVSIPLPPLPEQQEIARILRAVDRRIETEEVYKRALDELFKTLLQYLMTGKIRVKLLASEDDSNKINQNTNK